MGIYRLPNGLVIGIWKDPPPPRLRRGRRRKAKCSNGESDARTHRTPKALRAKFREHPRSVLRNASSRRFNAAQIGSATTKHKCRMTNECRLGSPRLFGRGEGRVRSWSNDE